MRHAILLLGFVVVISAGPSFAKDEHWWQRGRLAHFSTESWESASQTPVNCSSNGSSTNCTGGNTVSWNHVTWYATIVDGETTFFASRTLSWRWQHSPELTENVMVKYAIDGSHLILIGNDGREFKMDIDKHRRNSAAEQLQECRNDMMDLHAQFLSPEALEASLRQMSSHDLFNDFVGNVQCSTLSVTFQDWGLLTQFEAARLAMLAARTGASSTTSQSAALNPPDDKTCTTTVSWAEMNPLAGLTDAELSEKAKMLRSCALADYQKGSDKWFERTDKARMKILTEIVARQTGAAIGEHAAATKPAGVR